MFSGNIAGLSSSHIHKLNEIGLKWGEILQIQDDIIDLLGNKGRKKTGNDLWKVNHLG